MPGEIQGINLQNSLKIMGNNSGLLKIILRSFLSKYRDACKELEDLLREKKIEEAARLIHSIKGISGNIGAEALHKAAEKLEHQVRSTLETDKTAQTPAPLEYEGMAGFTGYLQQMIDSLSELNLEQIEEEIETIKDSAGINQEHVFALLNEIRTLLKESDSRVRHSIPRLKSLLEGSEFHSAVQPLETAIFHLDSNLALKELKNLENRIQASNGSNKEQHAG